MTSYISTGGVNEWAGAASRTAAANRAGHTA